MKAAKNKPVLSVSKRTHLFFLFFFGETAGRMQKTWRKENLDIVLVPVSLLIMFGYHLFLLYRYLRLPKSTVIGYENYNKRAWVERMMQVRH